MNSEGNACLTLPDGVLARFRYSVSVIGDEMIMGLEDMESKQQWQSSGVTIKYFSRDNGAIPTATLEDYAHRFCGRLKATEGGYGEQRSVCRLSAPAEDGDRHLSIALTINCDDFQVSPTDVFRLSKVQLDPLHILDTRVRDLASEVAAMKRVVDHIEGIKQAVDRIEDMVRYSRPTSQAGWDNPRRLTRGSYRNRNDDRRDLDMFKSIDPYSPYP